MKTKIADHDKQSIIWNCNSLISQLKGNMSVIKEFPDHETLQKAKDSLAQAMVALNSYIKHVEGNPKISAAGDGTTRLPDEKLWKESLIAGLNLFGIPKEEEWSDSLEQDIIENAAERWNIDLVEIEEAKGSGLIWADSGEITEESQKEYLALNAENMGTDSLDNLLEVSDFTYVFFPISHKEWNKDPLLDHNPLLNDSCKEVDGHIYLYIGEESGIVIITDWDDSKTQEIFDSLV